MTDDAVTPISQPVKRAVLPTRGGLIPPSSFRGCGKIMAVKSSPWSATSARATITPRVRRKALRSGASKVFVEDLREEFVTGYRLEGGAGGRHL